MRTDGALAPVIPLFGGEALAAPAEQQDPRGESWHTTWTAPAPRADVASVGTDSPGASEAEAVAVAVAEAGEAALLRKLRTRSLSVREARAVLVERELDEASVDEVIARFLAHGYLDDAKLAEQLVHSAVERKGQGRMAVTQALAKRGIPREAIDTALAELPDDERERALAFARTKARSMAGLDREVALRRLSGQLARRGYGSHALSAARSALDELSRPARSGVRFES